MIHWSEYHGHEIDVVSKKVDNTIYTFDIESTSYLILNGEIISASEYLNLNEEDREKALPCACMYIWQFSINETVYYGRTWEEFKSFLDRVESNCDLKKYIFVHNLSFEFQFFSSQFKIKSVMSRKSRKVMSAKLLDYNIEFRCTYYMSNVSLAYLPKLFNLNVQKMVGDLDYTKLRTPATKMTKTELGYCEHDCLVVYEYIKMELVKYKSVNRIPMTSTGKVRKELQSLVMRDYEYRRITRGSINIKPSVYNMLVDAFAGGYTHANYMYTDEVIPNVDSYDETSAYPYVMVTSKFPMSEFKECHIKTVDDMIEKYAYLLKVTFHNLKCKYYNNFISASKCENIVGALFDNGRIVSAKEVTITLTDIDFRFFLDVYDIKSYEINESYYAIYKYLPKKFINFILEKYVNKTKFKNVKGKELDYVKEKNKFNSLYGMTVTNMIRDEVNFDNITGWSESELTDSLIFDKLLEEKEKAFLSFSWGVWVTAYARDNLLRRMILLDPYVVYSDTDSLKCAQGYDAKVFDEYNRAVIKKIKKVSSALNIPFENYAPEDSKGVKHLLGIFECETGAGRKYTYDKFITQGAKKYCVEIDGQIEITVSGVPKSGNKCLKRIEDFRDDLVFDYKYTNKQTIMYNDNQVPVDIVDYLGVKYKVDDKSGCCLLPTTYKLGKSLDYANLLTDNSTNRAKFKNRSFQNESNFKL
ncbi:MAG: hypothetical protein IKA08_00075 [Alphaproteobacteria bacterium]|nr:hypothetical protein [Alphaproteobacteria bacterium]